MVALKLYGAANSTRRMHRDLADVVAMLERAPELDMSGWPLNRAPDGTGKLQKTCKILMARKSLIHIEFFDLLQSARLCATIYAAAYTINTEFTAKRAR